MPDSVIKPPSTPKKSTTKGAISSKAIESAIPYKAKDSIRFMVKEQKVFLYGQAVVNYQEIELKADYIELDLNSSEVFARGVKDSSGVVSGRPVFKEKKDEFTCDELRYNFDTEQGLIKGVITQQASGYLHGTTTKKQSNDEVHIKNGKYTTCSSPHPHFYIMLSKAKVIPDDKIVTGPAMLVIEDLPTPLWLPFGFFPNQEKHKSGIIFPEYGEEINRGFYLKNGGYYMALGDYASVSVLADIYSKLSWGTAIRSEYKVRYKFEGAFEGRYNSNVIEDEVVSQAWVLRWSHKQDPKARPNSNFSAKVDFGSSSYNKYNANSIDGRLKNTTQSSISYRKTFANTPFNLSANLNHSQNFQDSTISLKLPVIALSMNRIYPFKRRQAVGGAKWYEKIGVNYTGSFSNSVSTREDDLFAGKAWHEFKNGIKNDVNISTSLKLFKFITVTPSASGSAKIYFKHLEQKYAYQYIAGNDTLYNKVFEDTISGFNFVYNYDVKTSFTTKLYGMYQFREKSKVNAIRHVVTPNVSISYRPDFGDPSYGFYDSVRIDTAGTMRQYSKYNGFVYGNAPNGKSGMINMGLNNNLEMKVRTKNDSVSDFKKIKLIESFAINSAYNLAADSLNWSILTINARTRLFNKVDVTFGTGIDPYAIDTLGQRINTFEWDRDRNPAAYIDADNEMGLGRLTYLRASLGTSFSSKKGDKKKDETSKLLSEDYLDYYVDFEIPWTLRINYNLDSRKQFRNTTREYEKVVTQTLRCSGDLNLTNKWKIGFSSGYDMTNKKFTTTSVDIYRDLHCWEMVFNWVPFGNYLSYNFTLKAKASILQDLKLNKRKSWYDNF